MKNFRVVSRARTHGMISACTCVISHWHSHPIIGRARKDFNLPTRQARVKLFIFGGHATDCCNYSRESPWKVKKKRDEQQQRKKVSIASNSPASSLIIDARHEVAEKKASTAISIISYKRIANIGILSSLELSSTDDVELCDASLHVVAVFLSSFCSLFSNPSSPSPPNTQQLSISLSRAQSTFTFSSPHHSPLLFLFYPVFWHFSHLVVVYAAAASSFAEKK